MGNAIRLMLRIFEKTWLNTRYVRNYIKDHRICLRRFNYWDIYIESLGVSGVCQGYKKSAYRT